MNQEFNYKKINDYVEGFVTQIGLNLFDLGEINIVKVVQHGLVDAFINKKRLPPNKLWGKPYFLYAAWQQRKHRVSKTHNYPIGPNLVIDENPRFTEHKGKVFPTVFHQLLQSQESIYLYDYKLAEKVVGLDKKLTASLDFDSTRSQCISRGLKAASSGLFYRDIQKLRKRLKLSDKIQEKVFNCIDYWLEIFFLDFVFYSHLFKALDCKNVYIICHYHNEGLIAAARKLSVKVIELQHGLISKGDLYYAYDDWIKPVAEKALFQDELWVYGQYWKDLIIQKGSELKENQIIVKGYYHFTPDIEEEVDRLREKYELSEVKKPNILLVTSQTWLSSLYIEYISHLRGLLSKENWIVLKIHPRSNLDEFASIMHLQNVIVSGESLDAWMEIAGTHISVYSTTLFDAHRFTNLRNFTLMHPTCEEYVQEIVNDGVADLLHWNDNPFAMVFNTETKGQFIYEQSKLIEPVEG